MELKVIVFIKLVYYGFKVKMICTSVGTSLINEIIQNYILFFIISVVRYTGNFERYTHFCGIFSFYSFRQCQIFFAYTSLSKKKSCFLIFHCYEIYNHLQV